MVKGTVKAVGPQGLVAMDFRGRLAILKVDSPPPKVGDVVQAATLDSGFLSLTIEASSMERKGRVVAFHPSAAYVFDLLADSH